ncbi:MAG: PIG-L family deacetylase [Phycisphaerales bacterium]|nr:PIG-L family deacetylase [Phycisphaerales bacterium]
MSEEQTRVLVIAAHPDDEVLGCGGAMALHRDRGDEVKLLIACEGESLRYGEAGVGQHGHIEAAAAALGVNDWSLLGFNDQTLDTTPQTAIIDALMRATEGYEPNVVYCQSGEDVNSDHLALFRAALVAFRPTAESVRSFLTWYTASSTDWAFPRTFTPDTWVDISEAIDRKIEAMACYESEVRAYPHPRSLESIRAQAQFWGTQACLPFAEVFRTVRRVELPTCAD